MLTIELQKDLFADVRTGLHLGVSISIEASTDSAYKYVVRLNKKGKKELCRTIELQNNYYYTFEDLDVLVKEYLGDECDL